MKESTERTDAHPRRWDILGVMSISIFMLMLDNTIVNTALPSMARELRASTGEMQWIVDGYVWSWPRCPWMTPASARP
jgi:MFS family permease